MTLILDVRLHSMYFNSPYGAVVTHLTCNEKIRGSNPRAGLVEIRRFRVRIPGRIVSPVGPTARRLTTDTMSNLIFCFCHRYSSYCLPVVCLSKDLLVMCPVLPYQASSSALAAIWSRYTCTLFSYDELKNNDNNNYQCYSNICAALSVERISRNDTDFACEVAYHVFQLPVWRSGNASHL